jgi:hypothetical protein
MPNTVRLHRVLATKPDKIYRAFIEADAIAKWLPPNGFSCTVHYLDAKVGGHPQDVIPQFYHGHEPFFRRKIFGARSRRALALHGQIRGSQFAGRNAGDGDAQASLRRHRADDRAGRHSRRHSGGGMLSRLAGFVAKSRQPRRARNQSIVKRAIAQMSASGARSGLGRKRMCGKACADPEYRKSWLTAQRLDTSVF